MLHIASTLVLVLIVAGLYHRRRPQWHLRFMLSAFVVDLMLVLYIEATRGAVEKVAGSVNSLLWFHAGISLAVLLCYLAMIGLGRKLLAGQTLPRMAHRNLGIAFCLLRTSNYVTSYMV